MSTEEHFAARHGGQQVGTGDGEVLDNDLLAFNLLAGQHLEAYNFCELEPSSISGVVHVDNDGDCVRDADESPLEGVAIELRDAGGNLVASTTTDSEGRYQFNDLAPGEYRIFELQPDGLFQGGQLPGSGQQHCRH